MRVLLIQISCCLTSIFIVSKASLGKVLFSCICRWKPEAASSATSTDSCPNFFNVRSSVSGYLLDTPWFTTAASFLSSFDEYPLICLLRRLTFLRDKQSAGFTDHRGVSLFLNFPVARRFAGNSFHILDLVRVMSTCGE